jgi:exopolyphosphatase/guanosine-5'-triphosphate,3'-diphosphate pyrophosphatase
MLVLDDQARPLARRMEITRLGQGVDETHQLASDAIARTVDVLTRMRKEMLALGVVRGRLVATSAVRDARNGTAFLRAASSAAGLTAELLSGDEEGRLAYAGATSDIVPGSGDDVVVDIGGGSTELVMARDGRVAAVSLDMGCVRLTERYFPHDPPTSSDLAVAGSAVAHQLDLAERAMPALSSLRAPARLIGLAGTVATLASLDQHLECYDRERIHHYPLTIEAVEHWWATLVSEPSVRRAARTGMEIGRHDVIVGGVMVLRQVMQRFGFGTCIVSEADILDGIALGLLGSRRPREWSREGQSH